MCVLNDIDRFQLVMDVIDRLSGLSDSVNHVRQHMSGKRAEHKRYIVEHGQDMQEMLS